ncbi:MAG: hypothetical protein NZ928_03980 [Endomicrobia bacterium]|nr:hypothetical protein [Endomicrobiia bacterium]MDW8056140.1 hypothetical protein [Elusimicrobiota bacterium]
MKNKTNLIKYIVCVLLIISSCGPKRPADVKKEVSFDFGDVVPFQQLKEEIEGTIVTGIGFSEKRANLVLAREAAITSALADLARKVETKLEGVWKRTMADWTEYMKDGVNEAMSIEEMKSMIKNIVDTELRGPWLIQEKIQKSTGRYWVRILLSSATVEKWLKQRMNTEALLRKYIIESQIKKVQEDLQKDLDMLKDKEKKDVQSIKEIIKE